MKEGSMSSQYGLKVLGYTRATMVITERNKSVSLSKSFKRFLSSDCSLKFEDMKRESLVIGN